MLAGVAHRPALAGYLEPGTMTVNLIRQHIRRVVSVAGQTAISSGRNITLQAPAHVLQTG